MEEVIPANDGNLLDWFAGQASDTVIASLVLQYQSVARTNEPETWDGKLEYSEYHCKHLAKIEARYRYAVAVEMLAERNRRSKP